jgi:hypothetical protein
MTNQVLSSILLPVIAFLLAILAMRAHPKARKMWLAVGLLVS